MKRVFMLASIFGPAVVIISLSIWAARSARAVHAQEPMSSGQVVVPSGTEIRVRLVQGVTAGTRIGENLQALTEPIQMLARRQSVGSPLGKKFGDVDRFRESEIDQRHRISSRGDRVSLCAPRTAFPSSPLRQLSWRLSNGTAASFLN